MSCSDTKPINPTVNAKFPHGLNVNFNCFSSIGCIPYIRR